VSDLRWHISNQGSDEGRYYLVAVSEEADDHLPTIEIPDYVVAAFHHAELTWRAWQIRLAELFEHQQAERRGRAARRDDGDVARVAEADHERARRQ